MAAALIGNLRVDSNASDNHWHGFSGFCHIPGGYLVQSKSRIDGGPLRLSETSDSCARMIWSCNVPISIESG